MVGRTADRLTCTNDCDWMPRRPNGDRSAPSALSAVPPASSGPYAPPGGRASFADARCAAHQYSRGLGHAQTTLPSSRPVFSLSEY